MSTGPVYIVLYKALLAQSFWPLLEKIDLKPLLAQKTFSKLIGNIKMLGPLDQAWQNGSTLAA